MHRFPVCRIRSYEMFTTLLTLIFVHFANGFRVELTVGVESAYDNCFYHPIKEKQALELDYQVRGGMYFVPIKLFIICEQFNRVANS